MKDQSTEEKEWLQDRICVGNQKDPCGFIDPLTFANPLGLHDGIRASYYDFVKVKVTFCEYIHKECVTRDMDYVFMRGPACLYIGPRIGEKLTIGSKMRTMQTEFIEDKLSDRETRDEIAKLLVGELFAEVDRIKAIGRHPDILGLYTMDLMCQDLDFQEWYKNYSCVVKLRFAIVQNIFLHPLTEQQKNGAIL